MSAPLSFALTVPTTKLPFQKGNFLVAADFNGAYGSANGFEIKSDARLGDFVLKGLAVGGGFSSKVRTFKENQSKPVVYVGKALCRLFDSCLKEKAVAYRA